MNDKQLEINWYVIFVMGGRESSLCTFFRQEGFEAFFPQVEVMHRKAGKKFKVMKPLFPSYIFVKSDIKQIEFQEKLKNVRLRKSGIIKELKYDNFDTSSLLESEKNFLENILNDKSVLLHSTGTIEGEQIVIISGPLKGYENRIVKINRHKQEALLKINMLGKDVNMKASIEIKNKM